MAKSENTPLSELVTGLVSDVTGLIRKEVDLAKTEASEKFSQALTGVELLLVGVVFAIGAVGVLLSALVSGLAAVFVRMNMHETSAQSLAAVIVGVVFAAIAWVLMSRGLKSLRARNLSMDRTADSLRRDVNVVKERT